jgi:hypothetical protein
MRTVLTLLCLLLVSVTAAPAFTASDSLKTQEVVNLAVEKILIQDKQNRINERKGVASQNNYIIDIDIEHWIEEKGTSESKILTADDLKRMSQNLQAFNSRKDGLRLYVIVINDYIVKFETRIDPSLVEDNFKWNDLQKYTKQQDAVKEIWSKTSNLINSISAALEGKGFTERMIYFYSQLKVYEYDDTPHRYKFDRLNFIGKAIEPLQEDIRKQIKVKANGAVSNIDQAINSIINGTKAVVDGEGDVSVDCSQSIETIAANTRAIQTKELDTEVAAFAKLIDNPTSAQQKGSRYMIIDQPESFASDDLFTNEILPDKLAMLAQSGNSDYKLYVIFKEIKFVLPSSDWEGFAKRVAEKSSVAKQSNAIVMVVPYFKTICTGSNWLGMPVSKGTGITMAAVYTSASLKGAMNSALSAPGNSWKSNFNQAFKQIPKAHTVYAYSFLWNGDFTQHEVNTKKNVTGYENFNDIVISDDGRYEELKKAETFLSVANIESDVLHEQTAITDEYVNGALSAYFTMVETAMGSEQLVKIKIPDDVKQSKITEANATLYARWLWIRKTDRATHFNLPNTAPGDDFFYGGVNKVTAQEFIHVLDAASFATSFVGLDFIFDTWQAYYAYDKGFYQDAAIASAAVVAAGVTAVELKTIAKALRRGERVLVKFIYNNKLVVSTLSKDRVYASFIPIIYKLDLQNILSSGVVSAIQNKQTFLSAIGYARKAEYQSLVQAFEKAVNESDAFKQLINSDPSTVDIFFKYSKQKPAASVDEILELAAIAKDLRKKQLDNFIADFGDAGFRTAVGNDKKLLAAWKKVFKEDNALSDILRKNTKVLEWISKHDNNIPQSAIEDLLVQIDKPIKETIEDAQGRLTFVLDRPGQSNKVVSVHPTANGQFKTTTFTPAYNPNLNPNIPAPLSNNRLVPNYIGTEYMHPLQGNDVVKIKLSGNRDVDFARAREKLGISIAEEDAKNYVWHHMDDFEIINGEAYGTMQLVERTAHGGTGVTGMQHSGSAAQWRAYYGSGY